MFRRSHDGAAFREADALRDPAVGRIDTPGEYQGAIAEVLGRAAAAPGTVQAERLAALIAAVEDYEARHGHDVAEDDRLSVRIRHLRRRAER